MMHNNMSGLILIPQFAALTVFSRPTTKKHAKFTRMQRNMLIFKTTYCKALDWSLWFACKQIISRLANNESPDQTAPLGAIWSGPALFTKAFTLGI